MVVQMNLNSRKYNLDEEHKEMGKDILSVIISYTPLSGILDTGKFLHKWVIRRRGVHRLARSVGRYRRRLRLKSRTYMD